MHVCLRARALQVAADFVIVDVSPSNDEINKNIVQSADVVLPPGRPDSFTWSTIVNMVSAAHVHARCSVMPGVCERERECAHHFSRVRRWCTSSRPGTTTG